MKYSAACNVYNNNRHNRPQKADLDVGGEKMPKANSKNGSVKAKLRRAA